MKTKVSIVIVNYGNPADTCACLDSLRLITYPNYEIIVVDNGSEIDRTELFKSFNADCQVITRKDNGGFAAGANAGIRKAIGGHILLLNNDTVVSAGFLEPLVETLESERSVGMVSPQIRYYHTPAKIQYAGASTIHPIFVRGKKRGHLQTANQEYDEVSPTGLCNGACMLIDRRVFEDIGLLPEKYFMYYEEHDFTQRARFMGWNCFYVGTSVIFHKQSQTLGHNSPLKTYYLHRNRILYTRTFQQGLRLMMSLGYLYSVSLLETVKRLLKRDTDSARSIMKAMVWHFNHIKMITR
jgi:GT2 family glycosyltransferase